MSNFREAQNQAHLNKTNTLMPAMQKSWLVYRWMSVCPA